MENIVKFKNRASKSQLVGFAGNNAATNALYILLSAFFLVYATTVYGYSPLLVGGLMTATRLLDAVTDPIIGIMVDKTNTKLGRFRPWIIVGSILSNIMFLLLFSGIDLGSSGLNLAFLITVYIVWVFGYTFQTSISKAGQNVLTSDPKQRTSLNAISGIMTMVVYVTALTVFPKFMGANNEFAADPAAWLKLALVMVVIQLIFTAAAVYGIWTKDVPENYNIGTVTEKPKAKDYIDLFKHNKALQMLIVAASTNKIAYSMGGGMIVFFYAYVALNPALQSVVTPTSIIFMLLATIIALIYTNKVGRKKAFKNLSFFAMIYAVVAIVLIAIEPSNAIWLILVLGINVFFQGSTDLNVIPMIGDAADYENYQRGRFIPGMIGTSFSLIDKIVSSLSTTLVGLLLTLLGYVSLTDTTPTPLLFWGILIVFFGVPGLGHLASVIAMKYYPITTEVLEKMHIELEARKNK